MRALDSGLMIPLTDAKILAPFLIGFTLEQIGIDSLVDEFKDFVAEKAKEGLSQDEIVAQLHEILKSRGQSLISVETTKGIYKEPPEAAQAVSIWMKAKTLAAGKKEILSVSFLQLRSLIPRFEYPLDSFKPTSQ